MRRAVGDLEQLRRPPARSSGCRASGRRSPRARSPRRRTARSRELVAVLGRRPRAPGPRPRARTPSRSSRACSSARPEAMRAARRPSERTSSARAASSGSGRAAIASGVLLGRLDQRGGRAAGRAPMTAVGDRRVEHRIRGHQRARLDDLGLVVSSRSSRSRAAMRSSSAAASRSAALARSASASASAGRKRTTRGILRGMGEDPRAPDREPGRRRGAAQHPLAHQLSCSTAR